MNIYNIINIIYYCYLHIIQTLQIYRNIFLKDIKTYYVFNYFIFDIKFIKMMQLKNMIKNIKFNTICFLKCISEYIS